MAAHDAAATIPRAIRSVLSQTMSLLELVVVDDGSSDDTWACLASWKARDPRIVLIRSAENHGPAAARNRAIRSARGDWIAILDADDEYLPHRLEALLDLGVRLEVDFVFDSLLIRDEALGTAVDRWNFSRGLRPVTPEWWFSHDLAFQRHPVGYCKPLVRRGFLERTGLLYRDSFLTGEDFMFVSDLVLAGGRGYVVPQAYYLYSPALGPLSRRRNTRALTGRDPIGQLVQQSRQFEFLLAAHGSRISFAVRRILEWRHRLILGRLACLEFKSRFEERCLWRAVAALLREPMALLVLLVGLGWRALTFVDPPRSRNAHF